MALTAATVSGCLTNVPAKKVTGKIAQLGDKALPNAAIFVDNKPIMHKKAERTITLLMNKPKGYLCTNSDPFADKTVFQLLQPEFQRLRSSHKFYCK